MTEKRLPECKVQYFEKDSKVVKSEVTVKNLSWVMNNMQHIEIVTLENIEGFPTLLVEGSRNDLYFYGTFPFSCVSVLREWVDKRKHFHYLGISDNL